jgi:ornithine decarboxylase
MPPRADQSSSLRHHQASRVFQLKLPLLYTQQHAAPSNLSISTPSPLPARALTESSANVLEARLFEADTEDAFFVADLDVVVQQWDLWQQQLPMVTPFFAVKSNPDPVVLRVLSQLGASFDCASRTEIDKVLAMGVHPDRIIYANPCKQTSHLRFASAHNVQHLTFDNSDELHKLKRFHPHAKALLRIQVDDSQSVCRLGNKFGAELSGVPSLFHLASQLDIEVVGVSFHVGSGCKDAQAFGDALKLAKQAWDIGLEGGHDLRVLDIGGGFPGSVEGWEVRFEEIAAVVREGLDLWKGQEVSFIAEPGRFFVEKAFTLAVAVIARRHVTSETEADKYMYYVNDGVYGSFNCLVFDHAICNPKVLTHDGEFTHRVPEMFTDKHESSVFGPTCDGIDRIHENIQLPKLQVGDWMAYERMGAYTVCAASQFNGFKQSRVVYTDTAGHATQLVWDA